jgi:hypothetical protein
VSLILEVEKIQRRATIFILSLPFRSETSYQDRLLKTGLLPLSYWHEYLDLMNLFKAIKLNDSRISIVSNERITRRATTNSVTLKISKVNTETFQNSFYNKASRLYNSLPPHIREASVTVGQFKSYMLRLLHMMNMRFSLLNMAQRILGVTLPNF